MAWARIDDGFDDHPKVLALLDEENGGATIGLWTLCLTYAHRNTRKKDKTPGMIPVSLPRRFLGPEGRELADMLVRVGLWDEVDGGWMIHDFAEYLPTKEMSSARSAAGKKGAAARWGDGHAKQDDGKTMATPKQTDGSLPQTDGSLPSGSGKAVASDGSRAGARRVRVPVGVTTSNPGPSPVPVPPTAGALEPRREHAVGKPTKHAQADDLTAKWWEHYKASTAQSFIAVRGVIRTALANGLDRDAVAHAVKQLGEEGRAISGGSIQTAMQQRTSVNGHRRSTTDERVAQAQALKGELRNFPMITGEAG